MPAMEIKQIAMLAFLLVVAAVGSGILVYVLSHLDSNEEKGENHEDSHGHGH